MGNHTKKPGDPTYTPCDIHYHSTCDGSGSLCKACGDGVEACECGDPDEVASEGEFEDCAECKGTGLICTIHNSPSRLKLGPCDAMKKGTTDAKSKD